MLVTSRLPAKKVRIIDLTEGRFFFGNKQELKPSYIITNYGEKISRVNLLGTIIEKFEGENFSSVTLDDSTGVTNLRQFGAKEFFSGFNVGDIITVIGKVKQFNDELYIISEIVRKIRTLTLDP